ncbi:MAG: hypothetical protein U1E87_10250 [Alphaproteobacteria bacterium]
MLTANPDTMSPDMTAIDALRLARMAGIGTCRSSRTAGSSVSCPRGDFESAEQDRLEEEREEFGSISASSRVARRL